MIIVRDIFRVKFGQAKEATALWKQMLVIIKKQGHGQGARLLTDLAGLDYYTLVLESTYDSLAQWEQAGKNVPADSEWKALYQKIVALTETGHREILRAID